MTRLLTYLVVVLGTALPLASCSVTGGRPAHGPTISIPLIIEARDRSSYNNRISDGWCDYGGAYEPSGDNGPAIDGVADLLPTLIKIERSPRNHDAVRLLGKLSTKNDRNRLLRRRLTRVDWAILRMPFIETALYGSEVVHNTASGKADELTIKRSYLFVPVYYGYRGRGSVLTWKNEKDLLAEIWADDRREQDKLYPTAPIEAK